MIALLMYFDWKIGLLCLSTIIVGFLIMGSFMTGPKLKKDMESYDLALENMTKEAVVRQEVAKPLFLALQQDSGILIPAK